MYGFLLALMAYNAILYFSLRSSRYLRYSIYLAMFVAMNIAYTGHGFAWLWPDSVNWQQWSNPILMLLFGVSGLLFAIRFLDLRVYFPRVRRAVLGFCMAFGILLGAAILAGSQEYALLAAFSFAFLFSGLMLFLGIISVRIGQKPAKYFLIAALAAMVGVGCLLIASAIHFSADGHLSLHEVLVALFLFMTAPVSAHLLAKAALHLKVKSLAPTPAADRSTSSDTP